MIDDTVTINDPVIRSENPNINDEKFVNFFKSNEDLKNIEN